MASDTQHRFEDVLEPVASSRTRTRDGYLTANAVLAKAGVFPYRAGELGIKDRKPDEMVAVYRSADVLGAAVETFEAQPIALDHKWMTSANWRANAIGDVRDVEMQADDMVGTLIVRDAKGIRAVEDGGKTQLSNGYHATIVHRPGTYKGQAYEYEQTNLVGNHIALVDKARCGNECRIADEEPPQKELFMTTRNFDGLTLTFENPQSGEVFDRMARALEETKKELATLKDAAPKVMVGDKALTGDEVKALFDCKCQELEAAKKETITPEEIQRMVVERSKVMTEAKDLAPDVKVGDADTAHDIRVHVLDALVGKEPMAKEMLDAAITGKLADAPPASVAVAFSTIAAGLRKAKEARKVSDSRFQVGRVADAVASQREEKDARTLHMERQANNWKSKEVN